jgi:1-acyl-sn-glycerol-3-phosphate acyltransferase
VKEPNPKTLKNIAKIITTFGRWYNGFESFGDEHIPSTGPALVVFYHGLMPLDAWYFGLNYYLKTGRLIRGLGDRWLFKAPGMKQLVRAVGGVEGRPQVALQMLKDGHLVGVSPGGVREAISGTENNYKLIWGKRLGFAKLAIEANVPIIPGFTKNVEEIYRAPFAGTPLFQAIYEATRLPLVPFLGLGPLPFPAKLITYIGEPIHPKPGETPESLKQRTQEALEQLIMKYQPKDQTILSAIKERL